MIRCFFWLLLPVICAAALVAALVFRPHADAFPVGCVDADALFESRPGYILLKETQSEYERLELQWRFIRPLRDGARTPSRIAAVEWEAARGAVTMRSRRLSDLWADSTADRLRRDYSGRLAAYQISDARGFAESEAKLKEILENIGGLQAVDDPLAEERFRLMNLRIKLAVLTHDPFVFPEERIRGVESEIATIQKRLDEFEESRLMEISNSYKRDSEAVIEKHGRESEEEVRELRNWARLMLDDAETILAMILENHRLETAKRLEAGMLERERMLGAAAKAGPNVVFTAGVLPFDAIETELRAEFDRRMRRRAPAVAEKYSLSVLIATPFPPPGAVDVTSDFR